MIISIAHQKGGTGKSTLAVNLAVEMNAALLDLDKQHSSVIFTYQRQQEGLLPVPCYTIAESQCRFDCQQPIPENQLAEFAQAYKGHEAQHLVVDVGGFDSPLNRKALFLADTILTPCAPSAIEIYGLQMFEEILEEAYELAGVQLISHVVINRANKRSPKRIAELQEFIRKRPAHLRLCRTVIGSRMAFKTAYESGRSVCELYRQAHSERKKAVYQSSAEEIESLIREVAHGWRNGYDVE